LILDETSLSPDRVYEIIKENYLSLSLRLQDNIDKYDKYFENPKETPFLTQLIRQILFDFKQHINIETINVSLLNNFAFEEPSAQPLTVLDRVE